MSSLWLSFRETLPNVEIILISETSFTGKTFGQIQHSKEATQYVVHGSNNIVLALCPNLVPTI